MKCPFCNHPDTQVVETRESEDGGFIRRRRRCGGCDKRFTTYERVQLRELMVIKKSGRKLPFDREKLVRSFEIALRKRPVDRDRIERAVSGIVRRLESSGETEIPSEEIGLQVLEALKSLDDVAFVRYASVYRDFSEAKDFEEFASSVQEMSGRDAAKG